MAIEPVILVLITVIGASTPLAAGALGEVVAEKAGVLNLGVEGMMLVGAVAAFATAVGTESSTLALLAAADGRRADGAACSAS